VIAEVLKKQEEMSIGLATKTAQTVTADHLELGGYKDASDFIKASSKYLETKTMNHLLAELHPEHSMANLSGVAQKGADIRRLVKNIRDATPVAHYKIVDPFIAATTISDLVAVAFAQKNLNVNSLVPNECPANVTSVYESKNVVQGKEEWVSCELLPTD
jgi:hypothetical protein